jgi:hypothetical protein
MAKQLLRYGKNKDTVSVESAPVFLFLKTRFSAAIAQLDRAAAF